MRTCDDAWTALDHGYKAFMECLGELTEEELTSTPVAGKWTAKDVVAHMWIWLEEAARTVRAWTEQRPWQEGVTYDDAWNELQVAQRAALPLITVLDGLTRAHRGLMHLLDVATPEELARTGKAPWNEQMPLVDFFYSMAQHYDDHITDLQVYQKHCLEGCD